MVPRENKQRGQTKGTNKVLPVCYFPKWPLRGACFPVMRPRLDGSDGNFH